MAIADSVRSDAENDSEFPTRPDAEPSPSKSVTSVAADEIIARAPSLRGAQQPVLPDLRPILPARTSLQRWKVRNQDPWARFGRHCCRTVSATSYHNPSFGSPSIKAGMVCFQAALPAVRVFFPGSSIRLDALSYHLRSPVQ